MNDHRQQTDISPIRDAARGMAIRAGLLAVGAVVVGAGAVAVAAEAAGGVVKIAAAATVLAAGSGVAISEFKRIRHRLLRT